MWNPPTLAATAPLHLADASVRSTHSQRQVNTGGEKSGKCQGSREAVAWRPPHVLTRQTLLRRRRNIAANIDQVVIVSAILPGLSLDIIDHAVTGDLQNTDWYIIINTNKIDNGHLKAWVRQRTDGSSTAALVSC